MTTSLQHIMQLAKEESMINYDAPPLGSSTAPSGTMQTKFFRDKVCPGFSGGALSILYTIPSGISLQCHPNPGIRYDGTRRIAYLPCTSEGAQLLTRFKVAFSRGLMFKIGTSQTSGLENQCCWTTIPNKTSLAGGPFGFPDYSYIATANQALDNVGIPSANDCLALLGITNAEGVEEEEEESENDSRFSVKEEVIPYDAPEGLENNFANSLKPLSSSIVFPSSDHPDNIMQPSTNIPSAPPAFADDSMQVPTAPPTAFAPSSSVVPLAPSDSSMPPPSAYTPNAPPAAFAPSFSKSTGPMQPVKIITADDLDIDSMKQESKTGTATYGAQENSSGPKSSERSCAICLGELSTEASVEIVNCHHAFHRACIVDALKHIDKCPICRKPISGSIQGKSPSGEMKIQISSKPCPGFRSSSISIIYDIPSGTQMAYHDNPGEFYHGTTRVAYLPNNIDGRKLLARLKYAWKRGLIFSVGTSLTSGRANQVIWASIHHKTSLSGGAHGWPDATFIERCNSSLDALQVPPPEQCIDS